MQGTVEEYMSAEKAAAILDVTPQMIRKLCRARVLPFYKVGRCIRIGREDFELYLSRHRVTGLVEVPVKCQAEPGIAASRPGC